MEQTPKTKSRKAELTRAGKMMMQFTSGGQQLGNGAVGSWPCIGDLAVKLQSPVAEGKNPEG